MYYCAALFCGCLRYPAVSCGFRRTPRKYVMTRGTDANSAGVSMRRDSNEHENGIVPRIFARGTGGTPQIRRLPTCSGVEIAVPSAVIWYQSQRYGALYIYLMPNSIDSLLRCKSTEIEPTLLHICSH